MTMRAHMQVNTATGVDVHNQPVAPEWTDADPIACKAWSSSRNEIADGNKVVTVEVIKAIFPLNALAGLESKRVRQVTDRLGNLLFSGPLHIQTVQRKSNHLLVVFRVP